MTTPIDIRADHLRIVHDVLTRHLPDGVRVWAFGSRATWATKDSSDLDLALEGDGEIPARSLVALESAFEDSDLPYAVDVVDVKRIGEQFREIVAKQRVPLPENASSHSTDWPVMSLRDAGISLIDCEHRTPPASDDGYPYAGIPQIKDGRVDLDGARRIAQEHFREWTRKANPRPFDVVLSRRCNPGDTGFVSARSFEFALGQNLVLLRADGEKILKPFLRWLVRSPEWWNQIGKYLNVGAVFDSLKCVDIPEFLLPIPPLRDQRVIAHILGTLDDKIELNRRMKATLEAMAQALFRSWFVDFDPVRAKMEGRDTGLPKQVADLFPDRLVDSEVGTTPEGWPLVPLPELMDLNPSRPLRKGDVAPYLDMANMPTLGHAPDSVVRRSFGSGMRFANGDTLVARITPCLENGKTAYVDFLQDDEIGWGSTEYIVMKPRSPLPSEFAYLLARTARFREFAIQNMSGTSGRQRVSASALSGFSMPSPPEAIGVEFGHAAQLLLGRARAAVDERCVLANCRDALLPKLISGEMRVRDAEKLVGAIA